MYSPSAFQFDDIADIVAHVRNAPFGCIISTLEDGTLTATHMPFVVDDQGARLISHMAKANPQWRTFAGAGAASGAEVLVVFPGPHGYISPRWYVSEFNVPTWNYTAVHAYGRPTLLTEPTGTMAVLDELVATHEAGAATPWHVDWSDPRNEKMLNGLVAFEVVVTRWEGKQKLNQNKSQADREAVLTHLQHSQRQDDQDMARLMARLQAVD